MLRLCSTNSSWLQGLWKKAESQVSFQMRLCACRSFSSSSRGTTLTPGSLFSLAITCSDWWRNGIEFRVCGVSPQEMQSLVGGSSEHPRYFLACGLYQIWGVLAGLERCFPIFIDWKTYCPPPFPSNTGQQLSRASGHVEMFMSSSPPHLPASSRRAKGVYFNIGIIYGMIYPIRKEPHPLPPPLLTHMHINVHSTVGKV